jgi:hypothetical protein
MSHAHPHPHPQPPAGMTARPPPQMMAQAQMPPHTAAILDALPFNPIPFVLKDLPPRPNAPPPLPALLCPEHEQLVCDKCNVDFRDINQLSFFMSLLNPSHPPPPPNVPFAKQGEAVLKTREEGNVSHDSLCMPDIDSRLTISQYHFPNRTPLSPHTHDLMEQPSRNGSRTATTERPAPSTPARSVSLWANRHGNRPSRLKTRSPRR